MNSLDEKYHKSLADLLRTKSGDAWVLTYDDCPEIRRMYRGWATIRAFSLRYAAAERRAGKEVTLAKPYKPQSADNSKAWGAIHPMLSAAGAEGVPYEQLIAAAWRASSSAGKKFVGYLVNRGVLQVLPDSMAD